MGLLKPRKPHFGQTQELNEETPQRIEHQIQGPEHTRGCQPPPQHPDNPKYRHIPEHLVGYYRVAGCKPMLLKGQAVWMAVDESPRKVRSAGHMLPIYDVTY